MTPNFARLAPEASSLPSLSQASRPGERRPTEPSGLACAFTLIPFNRADQYIDDLIEQIDPLPDYIPGQPMLHPIVAPAGFAS